MLVIFFLIYLKAWQKLINNWVIIPKYLKNLKEELNKIEYELDLPPELEIQEDLAKYRKEGKKPPLLPKPLSYSTPLKTKELIKFMMRTKKIIYKLQ